MAGQVARVSGPGPHTLWFRPTRRHKWRAVGTAPDHAGALLLIGGFSAVTSRGAD